MVRLFEEPCPDGWIYPCTLDEIRAPLMRVPPCDLEGLLAVGLVPATRKGDSAYAKYIYRRTPFVRVFSITVERTIKQPSGMKRHELETQFADDFAFGMRLEQQGSRWLCQWDAEDLRRFILEFVLPHEIGHHVCHMRRKAEGLVLCPGTGVCEQFADAYARRFNRI